MAAANQRMQEMGCYDSANPTPVLMLVPAATTPSTHLTWTQTPERPTAFPAVTLRPSITPPPTYTLVVLNSGGAGGVSSDCACSGNLHNCSDFSSRANAQACYDKCLSEGVGDIHELDSDDDGQACESLP